MLLLTYFLNPSAVETGIDSSGNYVFSYQGKTPAVTDRVIPVNAGGGWWHIRVTESQQSYMDAENISYKRYGHPPLDNENTTGGPSHVFGGAGTPIYWKTTSGDLVKQGPNDPSPIPVTVE